MSKFKVGDRVYGRTNVMNIEGACTITRIDPGHCICEYAACFDGHPRSDWWIYNDSVRPIQNKIIITTNGNTTLARLYEDKKVIKSAEAKCSPEDTFDFAVGAKLAFERLMGEKPDAEDVVDIDWDAFMSGKIAINLRTEKDVIALLSEIEQKYPGVTWRSGSKPTKFTTFFEEYKKNTLLGMAHGGGLTFCSIGGPSHTISKLPIVVYRKNPQPVETPTPKPAKLYCVKEYEAGEFLTKGKVYDVSGGNITYDDGWEAGWRGTNALGGRSVLGHYCVPLVRRRAKVGEWVYLTKEPSGNSTFPSNYHKGDIVRIASFGIMPSVASKGGVNWTGFREDEYLVLEGYKPEQDKQEFDWKAFAEGKIAVNCKTKPDALAFLRELESRYPDIRWRSGAEPSEINGWDLHKENTLYN
ncbi:MAG TPA: hypothetical protein DEA44_16800, partial [Firmicutes bacterium]|nr:hypothetical protein [Bacillota bacterium]